MAKMSRCCTFNEKYLFVSKVFSEYVSVRRDFEQNILFLYSGTYIQLYLCLLYVHISPAVSCYYCTATEAIVGSLPGNRRVRRRIMSPPNFFLKLSLAPMKSAVICTSKLLGGKRMEGREVELVSLKTQVS